MIARAPGKLILLGEYAVLEGAPALVMAVNRLARVELTPADNFEVSSPAIQVERARFTLEGDTIQLDADIDSVSRARLKFFLAILKTTVQHLAETEDVLPPCRILLETEAFRDEKLDAKLGLGSSAALTVATCAGLLAMAGKPVDDSTRLTIWRLSHQAHFLAQGKMGSGIDIAASVFGGVIQFEPSRQPHHLSTRGSEKFVQMLPIWSGKAMSTRWMLKRTQNLKTTHPQKFQDLMNHMKNLAQAGCNHYQQRDIPAFLETINQYYQAMYDLGKHSRAPIISKPHRTLAAIAHEQGAVYKPSGAGGGDLGLAFAESPDVITRLSRAVRQKGFEPVDLAEDTQGVRIESRHENAR